MARIGKIARLPQELREQLNHRLADGEPGGSLHREIKLRQLAALERKQAESQDESNLVQVKHFDRRDAETRRKREVGEEATERAEMSCGARRADSHLGDLAASRDESEISGGGRGESNLVQPKNFSGALGSGVRTFPAVGAYARSAGMLSNIYMRVGRAPLGPRRFSCLRARAPGRRGGVADALDLGWRF